MNEVMWRLLWISAIATCTAYATFLFLGSALVVSDDTQRKILAFDTAEPGQHLLKGVILVPSPCHDFTVKVSEPIRFTYHLAFETWEEPNRDCAPEPMPRRFETVAFGPALGVSFSASIDGRPLKIYVTESFEETSN